MSSQDTGTSSDVALSRRASKRAKLDPELEATEDTAVTVGASSSGSGSGSAATEQLEQVVNASARVVETNVETHELAPEVFIKLTVSWSGKTFPIELGESDRVVDLKDKLNALTSVPPDRQKIFGLMSGKLPPDDVTIRELKLTPGKKFTLMGTPIGKELQARNDDMPDVMNDFDVDVSQYPELMLSFANDQRNIRKVREATEKLEVHIMNEPREGKPLLVLDLDYTLLDTKPMTRGALPVAECARPGLHAFLEWMYRDYDICIWSQTSWVWLETKLVELEMVGADRPYKISFVLDQRPMFKVFTKKEGKAYTHSVKPLKVIWNKFPQWNATNTVHIDDLSRNFALNPLNGVKIEAFKDAHTQRAQDDQQLAMLSHYLHQLVRWKVDFTKVSHRHWLELGAYLHKGGEVTWNPTKTKFEHVHRTGSHSHSHSHSRPHSRSNSRSNSIDVSSPSSSSSSSSSNIASTSLQSQSQSPSPKPTSILVIKPSPTPKSPSPAAATLSPAAVTTTGAPTAILAGVPGTTGGASPASSPSSSASSSSAGGSTSSTSGASERGSSSPPGESGSTKPPSE